MISLKADKKDRKATLIADDSDAPAYPWGLSINLDEETIAKLRLTGLPTVGAKVRIVAMAEVSSVSQSQEKDGDQRRSITLQITDMEPPAKRGMYDKSEMNP